MQAPVDEDGARRCSATLAAALAGDKPQHTVVGWILDPQRLDAAGLEEAEEAAREASILRWFALQYPGVAGVTIERAAALEEAAAARVVAGAARRDRGSDDRPLPRLRRANGAVGDAVRPVLHGAGLPRPPALENRLHRVLRSDLDALRRRDELRDLRLRPLLAFGASVFVSAASPISIAPIARCGSQASCRAGGRR